MLEKINKKTTSRNTRNDIRQNEASLTSLTTSLLSSTKRQGHGNFTDACFSIIALPHLVMQAVVSWTASLFAMLWMQKWRFPSSKTAEPSNDLSIMHGVGDTMDCISHLYLIALWLDPHIAVRPVNLAFCGWQGVTYEEWNILHYHGTTTALPGHYYCTTTALPRHYCCTTTTHCWSWHGHMFTCRALWRRFCRLSRRTVSCSSISRHDDTLSSRLWTKQTLNVCVASILVTNNSFSSILNSVVRCCSCCSVPQMDTLRVITYMQLHTDKCIPSVG